MDNGDDLCEISSSHEAAMRQLTRMLTAFTTENTSIFVYNFLAMANLIS
ncbi:hypothetical protein MXB_1154 [Myxobolus squamalis]|nr:hypothetical protein MXB_1154 [Myxobolus squamalis]